MSAESHDPTIASEQALPDLDMRALGDHPETKRSSASSVPPREDYVAPPPARIDSAAPEEALRDPPLPDGYLTRLRRLVDDLPD